MAVQIAQSNLSCIVSVTTDSAIALYPSSIDVFVGGLTNDQLLPFLQRHQISVILDASHPFATEISSHAIAASTQFNIPYLRFERPSISPQNWGAGGVKISSFDYLLDSGLLAGERVLLTIGYRFLPLFQSWQDKATLFTRILPSGIALETALQAGFTSDRILALRPPISSELERALWRQWQISMVVTKASGAPGGEDTKRQVAADLGIKLVVVERPAIDYPQQTSDLESAIAFCRRILPYPRLE